MHHCKSGFVQGEHYATHSRRRYRLLPSRAVNAPTPDANMWIIHYSQAAAEDRIPTSVIPMDQRIQNILNARAYLKSQGQIVQKEFMLHDRANWPQINLPRNQRPAIYNANMQPVRVPQAMAYPPHPAMAGLPQKRHRTEDGAAVSAGHTFIEDDDEDTSRGDFWDLVQPREISEFRYVQNHLWMEEVISSQYPIKRIAPSDLGLGLTGELGKVTEGIFDAPTTLFDEKLASKHSFVGRLDPQKAADFRKRVENHVEQTHKEIERIKAKHAKRLAKFKKNQFIDQAEEDLRSAVHDPLDTGSEFWRLEGRIDDNDEAEDRQSPKPLAKVDDILTQVEASLNRHAATVKQIQRIQDGGYEEIVTQPLVVPQHAAHNDTQLREPGDMDVDMDGSTTGLMEHFNSDGTPGQTPSNLLTGLSAAGTPTAHVPSLPAPPNPPVAPPSATETSISVPGSDWVVIPPGGGSPDPAQRPSPSTATPGQVPPSHSTPSVPAEVAGGTEQAVATDKMSGQQQPTGVSVSQPIAESAIPGKDVIAPSQDGELGDLDLPMEGMGDDFGMGDLVDDGGAFGEAFEQTGAGMS